MSWSIAQVARMSKVTSRTLRHYDEIGLLPPAHIGGNGYRYYGRDELLRLQEILLLRDLGLGLGQIAEILDGERDAVAALRQHHRQLLAERDRLARLAGTVAKTIKELEGGEPMNPEELFEGFDPARQARYEEELVDRYGPDTREHIEASKRRMRNWTPQEAQAAKDGWTASLRGLLALKDAGVPVDDPRVLDAIDAHHTWLNLFWTPNRASYTGLGQLYADDPRFRDQIDAEGPGLTAYLRDAMAAYARARLN